MEVAVPDVRAPIQGNWHHLLDALCREFEGKSGTQVYLP